MERKKIDELEPGPVPPARPVDRFGFVVPEENKTSQGSINKKIINEQERYAVHFYENFVISSTKSIMETDFAQLL